MSKIEKLMEECTQKTNHNFWNLVKWSFMDNYKELQNISLFSEVAKNDLEQFIRICDNRLDRAKTFLNDIAVVLGFDFVALSIIANMAKEQTIWSLIVNPDDPILTILIVFLFAILIILFVLMLQYRSQVHAWTAFKEKAILTKLPEKDIE